MSPRCLADWLRLLEQRSPESVFRLGLERVAQVWKRLDIEPPQGGVLTVAGSNGKGSCALFAESLLGASGMRVGTTLSPHLARFNERIRIDGRETGDDIICGAMQRVEAVRQEVGLSYFEHAVLAALCAFDNARLDAWVLEVGLGGRLDAVNVVHADVAIISSIAMEHVEWLGHSLDAIGAEKAGVLRRGKPVVCGSTNMPDSVFVRARTLACDIHLPGASYRQAVTSAGFEFASGCGKGLKSWNSLPIPQVAPENAATAIMACLLLPSVKSIDRPTIEHACRSAVNPGRFERRDYAGTEVVLDLAHNPAAARFLRRQLALTPVAGRTRALAGFLSDKDVCGTIHALADVVDEWHFVSTPGVRGRSADDVAQIASGAIESGSVFTRDSVQSAMNLLKGVSCVSDRVLVFGSFATVGEARKFLDKESGVVQRPIAACSHTTRRTNV